MRNSTITVDDATYKCAQLAPAESLHETGIEHRKLQEREIRSQIAAFIAADRLNRDELHSRIQ